LRYLKLTLCYDGTSYHGWQIQPNLPTVQGEVERAIKEIFKEDIKVSGSSRTDAGVHAREYVVSFATECLIPCDKVPIALNTKLNDDVRAISCEEVDISFHARKSAKNKTYRYTINKSYDVFNRFYEWYLPIALNTSEMEKASKHFVGTHDFAGFMSQGSSFDTTVKTINSVDFKCKGEKIIIDINGDGFLYNMVRIIVGTLVFVGMGNIKSDDIPKIIESKKRENAGMTAPPNGLSLLKVNY